MIRHAAWVVALMLPFPWLSRAVARADETPAAAPSGVDAAMKFVEAGKFVEALDAAKAVPDGDATYLKARYVVGEMELVLGDPTAALEAFETVIAKKPTSAAALAGAGRAKLASKDPALAVPYFEKAVAADAKTARYRAWLGLARVGAEGATEGRKDLAAAEKLDAADVEVARAVVEALLNLNDAPGAEKAVAAFSKARKDHPFAPFLGALVADKNGKYDDAIALYEKAIALDPNFLDARRNLAIVCVTQNPSYTNAKRTKIALEQLAAYVKLGGRDESLKTLAEQLPQFVGPKPADPEKPTKPAK